MFAYFVHLVSGWFWKVFGNTKVFKFPLWFVYDPEDPGVDGEHLLKLMRSVRPGDIIMRGWRHYLNGFFIPGEYSHGGVCLGEDMVMHAVSAGVVKCNILDFAMADRVCVLRPSRGQEDAVRKAIEFMESKTPYDYKMTEGQEALYCFELCAECYKDSTEIKKVKPILMGGLITRSEPAWLSASFLGSSDFKKVFEYNPDRKVDIP